MGGKVIYTINFGSYDKPKPTFNSNGYSHYYFTDNPNLSVIGWKMIYIEGVKDAVKEQREIKINSHNYFPDADIIIYYDATFHMTVNPDVMLRQLNYKGGFMTSIHPIRDNVLSEATQIINLEKDDFERVFNHVYKLFSITKMPNNYGLFETGIIIRDNGEDVKKLNNKWFEFWSMGTHRDQITLPFASYATGVKVQTFTRGQRNQYFNYEKHLKKHEDLVQQSIQHTKKDWRGIK